MLANTAGKVVGKGFLSKAIPVAGYAVGAAFSAYSIYEAGHATKYNSLNVVNMGLQTGLEAAWNLPLDLIGSGVGAIVGSMVAPGVGTAVGIAVGLGLEMAVKAPILMMAQGIKDSVIKGAEHIMDRGDRSARMGGFRTSQVVYNQHVANSLGNALAMVQGSAGMGYTMGYQNRAAKFHRAYTQMSF